MKKIIYFCLTVLLSIKAYMLGFYLFKPDKVILDDVSLKDIEVKEENKGMAIMLGDKLGNYSASQESGFPNNQIYKYNSEKSGCIDLNGITVDGVLSYDDASSTVSLNTGMTVSCYLYFDMDKEAPTNSSISINNNATYTNSTTVNLTLASIGASHMCLSEDSNSCTNYVEYNTSYNYTLSNGDGTKTVYVTYKDYADNISEVASDSIILDTTAPVINSISDAGDGKISYTVTENLSGVSHYCVQTTNTSSGCNWVSISNGNQTTGVVTEEDGTFYLFLKDNAGNISVFSAITLSVTKYAGEYIRQLNPSGLNTVLQDGLYRFQGTTNVKNYICFGTSDKNTCLSDTDKHMYRILGIDSNNQLKLMKNEALNTIYKWHDTIDKDILWPDSYIYCGLNNLPGCYYSNIFINSDYIPEDWETLINYSSWKYGSSNYYYYNGAEDYKNEESAKKGTITARIGILYGSEYSYSYTGGTPNSYSNAYNSWINLYSCDSAPVNGDERIIYNTGIFETSNGVYQTYGNRIQWSNGVVAWINFSYTTRGVIRPTFFLNAKTVFLSGTGTFNNPFIIAN